MNRRILLMTRKERFLLRDDFNDTLAAGDQVIFEHVSNLSAVIVDSAVNGEGVAWLILDA